MKGWKYNGMVPCKIKKSDQLLKKNPCQKRDKFFRTKPKQERTESLRTHRERKRKDKKVSKDFGLAMFFFLAIVSIPFPSFAGETVGTVKVKFTVEEGQSYENGLPMMEGETNSAKYDIDEVITLEEYMAQWEEDSDDDDDYDKHDRKDNSDLLAYNETYLAIKDYSQVIYAVLIHASDNYYFSADMEKIKVSGLGAECVRLERLDSKTTLTLFVRFGELDDLAKEIERAEWSVDGYGKWTPSGAAWYELRIYKGDKLRRGKKITGHTGYDFRPLMQAAGSYRYMVRAVSSSGSVSEWTQSDFLSVSEDMASENRRLFAVTAAQDSETDSPPASVSYTNTGWQETEDGRFWYHEKDGSYPQMNWLCENGNWYYFDENGYMVKDCYIKWGGVYYYLDSEGRMMAEAKAPDGRNAQADGSLKWPES